jgi:hypothetical protein
VRVPSPLPHAIWSTWTPVQIISPLPHAMWFSHTLVFGFHPHPPFWASRLFQFLAPECYSMYFVRFCSTFQPSVVKWLPNQQMVAQIRTLPLFHSALRSSPYQIIQLVAFPPFSDFKVGWRSDSCVALIVVTSSLFVVFPTHCTFIPVNFSYVRNVFEPWFSCSALFYSTISILSRHSMCIVESPF